MDSGWRGGREVSFPFKRVTGVGVLEAAAVDFRSLGSDLSIGSFEIPFVVATFDWNG